MAVLAHAHEGEEVLLLLLRGQVLGEPGREDLLLLLLDLLDVGERGSCSGRGELGCEGLLLGRGELGYALLELELQLVGRELHGRRLG